MDEPFGALDAITKAALQDVLLNVQRQTDTTIVFITHDLDEAIYLSDRVLVHDGHTRCDHIGRGYRNPTSTRSIGDPRTTAIPAGPSSAWSDRCEPRMANRARVAPSGCYCPLP